MKLKTTTFEGRNTRGIQEIKDEAMKRKIKNARIIDFGPGGCIDFLFDYIGNPENLNYLGKALNFLARISERTLRKTDLFELKTTEPSEIVSGLFALEPKSIYVVDIESKVIDATVKYFKCNDVLLLTQQTDITKKPLNLEGDIVVAWNILERIPDRESALANISSCVSSKGLLATTYEYNIPGFERLSKNLYGRK